MLGLELTLELTLELVLGLELTLELTLALALTLVLGVIDTEAAGKLWDVTESCRRFTPRSEPVIVNIPDMTSGSATEAVKPTAVASTSKFDPSNVHDGVRPLASVMSRPLSGVFAYPVIVMTPVALTNTSVPTVFFENWDSSYKNVLARIGCPLASVSSKKLYSSLVDIARAPTMTIPPTDDVAMELNRALFMLYERAH